MVSTFIGPGQKDSAEEVTILSSVIEKLKVANDLMTEH